MSCQLQEDINRSLERGVTPLVVYRDSAPMGLLNIAEPDFPG